MNRLETSASIKRAIRGTRWELERFERMRTKVALVLHDPVNDVSVAYALPNGRPWAELLKTIRADTRKPHEEVERDLAAQTDALAAQQE